MNQGVEQSMDMERARKTTVVALLVGAVLMAGAALWGLVEPGPFFFGYLFAFMLWTSVPLGAAALLMMFHLTGGRWGEGIRRQIEAASLTAVVPLVFVGGVLLGIPHLYDWSHPAFVEHHHAVAKKALYLNTAFFSVRSIGFTLLWAVGGIVLGLWSRRVSKTDESRLGLKRLCAAGLLVYAFTVSFAGIDWVASLEPTWYSSIFGLYIIIGQAVAAMAICILLVARRRTTSAEQREQHEDLLHDLGNLLLAFLAIHAYFGFSQFFLIWVANLPHEIVWFLPRMRDGWGVLGVMLMIVHFALPFSMLLLRDVKRKALTLMFVAGVALVGHVIDMVWMVLPSMGAPTVGSIVLGLVAALGLGAVWFGAYRFSVVRLERVAPRGGMKA